MVIINGDFNWDTRQISPKQAAMLWDLLDHHPESLKNAIAIIQEWELLPYLTINGPEREDKVAAIAEFLHIWSKAFSQYAEVCRYEAENRAKKRSKKQKEASFEDMLND